MHQQPVYFRRNDSFLSDNQSNERFNLSLGQIYYIRDSRIDESDANSAFMVLFSSSWALESNWRINLNGTGEEVIDQYDTRLKNDQGKYNPRV